MLRPLVFGIRSFLAVTKSTTGTWEVGHGDVGTWDLWTWGRGDAGTRGCGDAGTWGGGDAGTWGREDFGTRRRAGIRVRDKQITPNFCAELVKP